MTNLRELHPRLRVAKIREIVDGLLKQAGEPLPTSALVKAVAEFLSLSKDDQNLAARDILNLAADHPMARQTEETFQKYGRTMRRWEWLPSHVKPAPNTPVGTDGAREPRKARLTPEELQRRRDEIAKLEDEWTVPASADFLEDE